MGTTSHALALALGHGSTEVTRRHYIQPGATEHATRERFQRMLDPAGNGDLAASLLDQSGDLLAEPRGSRETVFPGWPSHPHPQNRPVDNPEDLPHGLPH